MYLFDTDVLSNLMKQSPSQTLQAKMGSEPVKNQFTSSVTLGELIYGARKKGSARLSHQIEQLVVAKLPILPFDTDAARRYGEIRADLERRGTSIGDADIRIAAIALVGGLTVVTGNTRHFQRVPNLSVQNWL